MGDRLRLYYLEDEEGAKYFTIANNEYEARQNVTVDFDLLIGSVKIKDVYELDTDTTIRIE